MVARAGGRRGMAVNPAERVDELDYFFIGGQSNAAGLGVAAFAPPVPTGDGLEYIYVNSSNQSFEDVTEPVGVQANPPATGSAWSAFCNSWVFWTGRQPVVHSCAVGGTAQTVEASDFEGNDAWAVDGGLRYTNSLTQIDACLVDLEALPEPYTFRGILWDQGGKDAIAIDNAVPDVTKALYKAELEAMIAGFRTEYGANLPFYIFRLGRERAADTAGWIQVREAQDEVAAAQTHTHIVFDRAVHYPGWNLMRDEFHYTQGGYNQMGEVGARTIAELVF